MDANVAALYQYATTVVTRASLFLNLARPVTAELGDPSKNIAIVSGSGNPAGAELIRQLRDPSITKPSLGLAFAAALPTVLTGGDQRNPNSILGFVGAAAALPFKLIRDVIDGGNPLAEILALPAELARTFSHLAPSLLQVPFLLLNQLEVALSVLPTLQMFQRSPQALKNIDEALGDYFFTDGFTTVDGQVISHPQLPDAANLPGFKSLVSPKSAADFVRDAVKVPLEAGADVEYNLRIRLETAIGLVFGPGATPDQRKKLISWMRGFAAHAESATTAAVETLILGAGSVQTNSLIGAAAGTAAGTIAKKATQHVYLAELGAPLM